MKYKKGDRVRITRASPSNAPVGTESKVVGVDEWGEDTYTLREKDVGMGSRWYHDYELELAEEKSDSLTLDDIKEIQEKMAKSPGSVWTHSTPRDHNHWAEHYMGAWDYAFMPDEQVNKSIGGFMESLQSIPKRLKRMLNKNYKAFYRLHWVNEDLELTHAGKEALMDVLFTEFEDKLGKAAQERIAEIEAEDE